MCPAWGGAWNASSITGDRSRGNGVLNTELYAGVKVWNRMTVIKDPATGKRRPILKPQDQWRRTPVPDLRIVPVALWDQVRARKAIEGARRPTERGNARRPGIFSGLLKCGRCGASYTVYNDGRLICAAHREQGSAICDNRRLVRRSEIEERVLDGLRTRLLAPELVAAYVRTYRAEWAAAAGAREDCRRPLERRASEPRGSNERLVDQVSGGRANPTLWARLDAQEAELARIDADLAKMDEQKAHGAPSTIALHPRAPEQSAALVGRLQFTLAAASADPKAPDARTLVDSVRRLVTKIEITPASNERGAAVAITIHGDLARFIEPPAEQSGAPSRSRSVAGGGIEPPTCGL